MSARHATAEEATERPSSRPHPPKRTFGVASLLSIRHLASVLTRNLHCRPLPQQEQEQECVSFQNITSNVKSKHGVTPINKLNTVVIDKSLRHTQNHPDHFHKGCILIYPGPKFFFFLSKTYIQFLSNKSSVLHSSPHSCVKGFLVKLFGR